MPLEPAITDLAQLKDNPTIAALIGWTPEALKAAKWDRDELTLEIDRAYIAEVCEFLRASPEAQFTFLADLTAVDWFPTEPRFQVTYHLISLARKERVRLIVRMPGNDATLESVTSLWPTADFFEREIFDLFGIRFTGHPNLRRIMMPDEWEGHPLRKDYPVEGYR